MKRCLNCETVLDQAHVCSRCGDWIHFECDCDSLRAEVEQLRDERRWTPVWQRLPLCGHNVLTCHAVHGWVRTQAYNGSGAWIGFEPTHWMPLPPLPCEEVWG